VCKICKLVELGADAAFAFMVRLTDFHLHNAVDSDNDVVFWLFSAVTSVI